MLTSAARSLRQRRKKYPATCQRSDTAAAVRARRCVTLSIKADGRKEPSKTLLLSSLVGHTSLTYSPKNHHFAAFRRAALEPKQVPCASRLSPLGRVNHPTQILQGPLTGTDSGISGRKATGSAPATCGVEGLGLVGPCCQSKFRRTSAPRGRDSG